MELWKAWRNDNREQLHNQVSSVLEPRQLTRYDEMDQLSREIEKSLPMRALPMLQAPERPQAKPHLRPRSETFGAAVSAALR